MDKNRPKNQPRKILLALDIKTLNFNGILNNQSNGECWFDEMATVELDSVLLLRQHFPIFSSPTFKLTQ